MSKLPSLKQFITEEIVPEGQSHQEIGDLAIFLAPFGIYPR